LFDRDYMTEKKRLEESLDPENWDELKTLT
jgi:hypothetical protein